MPLYRSHAPARHRSPLAAARPGGLAILGAVLAAGPACTPSLNLRANRFESPETRGKLLSAEVSATVLDGGPQFSPVPDPAARPIETRSPEFDRTNARLRIGANVGLFHDLDAGLSVAWNGPVMLQAKYQLIGAHQLEAKAGNFSVALTAGVGIAQPNGEVSSEATGIRGAYDYSFSAYDFSLIAGKRVAETWMVYGGPFYTSFNYSGRITQAGAATGTFPLSGSASQAGAHLGLQLDSVIASLKLEEAWAVATSGNARQVGFYTGLLLGIRF